MFYGNLSYIFRNTSDYQKNWKFILMRLRSITVNNIRVVNSFAVSDPYIFDRNSIYHDNTDPYA